MNKPVTEADLVVPKVTTGPLAASRKIYTSPAAAPDLKVPHREKTVALKDIKAEVELGFDFKQAVAEAHRCLNCDVQTVFTEPACIECDACVDICPVDCLTFTENGPEDDLRNRLSAPAHNLDQALFISAPLKTGRILAKDEDVCLHCGLCAERCPTGAWDMQRIIINVAQAERVCCSK